MRTTPSDPAPQPNVSMLACVGRSGQLTFAHGSPFHDHAYLTFFQRHTMGKVIICGFRTAKLLPLLAGRTVCMLDRREQPEDVLERYKGQALVVVGGASTFMRWMGFCQTQVLFRHTYDGPAQHFLAQPFSLPRRKTLGAT